MEINKEQFRQLIGSDQLGSALNRLSDIAHFLGEGELRQKLDAVSEQYQEYLEREEAGEASADQLAAIKAALLQFIADMPEELPKGAGEEKSGKGGCFGAVAFLLLLATVIFLKNWAL